jgi:hypothetical protein
MFANIMRNATKFKEKMTQEIDDRMVRKEWLRLTSRMLLVILVCKMITINLIDCRA